MSHNVRHRQLILPYTIFRQIKIWRKNGLLLLSWTLRKFPGNSEFALPILNQMITYHSKYNVFRIIKYLMNLPILQGFESTSFKEGSTSIEKYSKVINSNSNTERKKTSKSPIACSFWRWKFTSKRSKRWTNDSKCGGFG